MMACLNQCSSMPASPSGTPADHVPRVRDSSQKPYPRAERLGLGFLVEHAMRAVVTVHRRKEIVGSRTDRFVCLLRLHARASEITVEKARHEEVANDCRGGRRAEP